MQRHAHSVPWHLLLFAFGCVGSSHSASLPGQGCVERVPADARALAFSTCPINPSAGGISPLPSGPRPTSDAVRGTGQAQAGSHQHVKLRAGLIEEVPLEADLPKVTSGSVLWRLEQSSSGERLVRASVEIGSLQGEISFARDPGRGRQAFEVRFRLLGYSGTPPGDAPRVRRTGAKEGEPLIGRMLRAGDGWMVFQSSPDPIDHENNVRRLTGPPWLDLVLRSRAPELVLTLEKGIAGNAMLTELLTP